MEHNIVENGNTFITVTSSQTTSVSSIIRNFTIAQGVNTDAATENQRKTISHNTTNDTFRTIYQNASSKTVNV
jgi:glutaredoxin 2